jgi:hypothetical protein
MFFLCLLTVENCQSASSSRSLESNVVQSLLQSETRVNSEAFDVDKVPLEVQPSQKEYHLLQTPSPSFNNIEQVETSTATSAFGDSLSQIVNTLGLQSFQNEDFRLSTSLSFNTKPGDISTITTNTQKLNDGPLMIEPAEELLPVIHIPEVGLG